MGRFDPSAYRLLRTRSINAIKAAKYQLGSLKDAVTFVKKIVSDSSELPYVGLENIESKTGFYTPSTEEKESFNSALKFETGDILFPKLRPYLNKVHLAQFQGVCSTEFHVLKGKNLNNLYLFTFLSSNLVVNQTTCLMTGNTLPRLQTQDVKRLPILLPPLEIQNHLAEIMQSAYAQKRQEEQEAEAVLDSIDDYVSAELGIEMPVVEEQKCFVVYAGEVEGRVDPSAYRSLKTSSVNVIKSSKYQSVQLKDVVMFRKEIVADSFELPYVGLENIESNTGFYVPSVEEKESFNSALKFESGDVLFPKLRPYLNKVHFAKFNGVCSTEFHVLKGVNLNNLYLFVFLRSQLVVNQTICLMTGNTLPRLQTQDVQRLPILLPPFDVQDKIADEVVRRQSEAAKLRQEAVEKWEAAKARFEAQLLNGEVS